MHDLTIQLVVYWHGYPGPPRKGARTYRRGEVVDVYPREKVTAPPYPGNPLKFVHVTGCPVDAKTLARILSEERQEPGIGADGKPYGRAEDETYEGRKVWEADAAAFFRANPERYAEIRDKGETTVIWAEARKYLFNKREQRYFSEAVELMR